MGIWLVVVCVCVHVSVSDGYLGLHCTSSFVW